VKKKFLRKGVGVGGGRGWGWGGREGERGGGREGEGKRNHVVKSNQDKKIQEQVVFMCIFLFLGKRSIYTFSLSPFLRNKEQKIKIFKDMLPGAFTK
jgi:hypothetical protein